ncbi:hypothetical protein HRbin40_02390 [bacterium HR40]|nr:hypothetical protein HRbin40_02390 [bacterium HR40]
MLLSLGLFVVTAAAEAAQVRCEGCHAGGPRLVFGPEGKGIRDIAIDRAARADSAHARLVCRDCHVGRFDLFPHPPGRRDTRRCLDCHPRDKPAEVELYAAIREEVAISAHGRIAGFVCEHCHDPHAFRRLRGEDAPEEIRLVHNAPCRACHEASASGRLADPARPDLVAVHQSFPHPGLHLAILRCIDCHDARRDRPVSHALPSISAIADGCGDCHGSPSVLENRFLRLRPEPAGSSLLTGARLLEFAHPTGAIRLWPADGFAFLAALLLLGLLGPQVLRTRPATPAPAMVQELKGEWPIALWHAATAILGLLLLASGLALHFGLSGPGPWAFAVQDRWHRWLGGVFVGLWLVGLGVLAAYRRDRLWFAPATGSGAMAEVRAYLEALLARRPLPSPRWRGGRFGHLQGRVYGLVVFLLLPGLWLSGLGLLAPERLSGRLAGLPGRSPLVFLHHGLALLFALFALLHLLLVLASSDRRSQLARMFGSGRDQP